MSHVEDTLREAGRLRRRVMVRFRGPSDAEHERELEPYRIENGELYAFSYLRNEFRTLRLADVVEVEITPRTFEPRRPVEL